jgi:hypothetical protein
VRQPRGLCAEQVEPVLLVSALSICEAQQDLLLFSGATSGEPLVHPALGTLLDEVAGPAAAVCGGPAVAQATVTQLQSRIDVLRKRVRS